MLNKLKRLLTHSPAEEQRSIQLADKLVTYTLKRSPKRRSIGLRIDERGLTVSMPLRASEKWLHSVLQDKARWVVDKLDNWQSKKSAPQLWRDGETLLFRGESFTLRVIPSLFAASPQLRGNELVVHAVDGDNQAAIEQAVTLWFRHEARRVFEECVAYFAPLMKVSPREIKLSSASTQWGSCTSQGVVRLNWRLVTMPLHLIDYVVVHELAHLVEMNHSAAFWSVVAAACPEYSKCRAELRKWSPIAE